MLLVCLESREVYLLLEIEFVFGAGRVGLLAVTNLLKFRFFDFSYLFETVGDGLNTLCLMFLMWSLRTLESLLLSKGFILSFGLKGKFFDFFYEVFFVSLARTLPLSSLENSFPRL